MFYLPLQICESAVNGDLMTFEVALQFELLSAERAVELGLDATFVSLVTVQGALVLVLPVASVTFENYIYKREKHY